MVFAAVSMFHYSYLFKVLCENSFKQTTQNNSLSLFPAAPSPSKLPHLPLISLSLSLTLFANFFFSFFSTYLHCSVSFTPSHPVSIFLLSVCHCLTHCQFLHLFTSLSSILPLPPISDVLLGRLKLCVVVMKRTEGQEWARHLHTHTREAPLRPEGHMKEVTERQGYTGDLWVLRSQHLSECVCVRVCV